MEKRGTLRPEQIKLAQRLLTELPEKDHRKTREEAAEILEKDFQKAFQKGYSPKDICIILKKCRHYYSCISYKKIFEGVIWYN